MISFLCKFHRIISPKFSLAILVFLICTSCLSVKPASIKSGKNSFETFYVGAEGTQYFIKPLLLEDKDAQEDLLIDFTFRYKNEIKDSAIINFSIKGPIMYKSIDSLKLINGDLVAIREHKIDLIFNEKRNMEFVSRFSTKISLAEIVQLFDNAEWNFVIYLNNKTKIYKPNKKNGKVIETLRDKVFIIM